MDFPKKVDIPSAWRGEFMQKHPDLWLWELDSHEIREIEKAAEQFIRNGESLGKISKENFALPNRGSKISKIQSKLRDGIGFTLVRGLPVEEYNAEQYSTIFCGIGSHIGGVRSQNAAGHLLGHVRDVGVDIKDPKARVYQTTARQHFHTDSCDVVGLLCLKEAKEGGISMLA